MKPAYCVSWQRDTMPAPAFWYYGTLVCAQSVYVSLGPAALEPPRRCMVPDTTTLLDHPRTP